jgi:hypothetical protein
LVCIFITPSKAWVCGRSLAGITGLNPAWVMVISLSWECCVSSGRGLCDELITRPEESYRLWFVFVCDLESRMRKPWPALGRSAKEISDMSKCTLIITSCNRALQLNWVLLFFLCDKAYWPRNNHLPQHCVDIKIPGTVPPPLCMPSQLDT